MFGWTKHATRENYDCCCIIPFYLFGFIFLKNTELWLLLRRSVVLESWYTVHTGLYKPLYGSALPNASLCHSLVIVALFGCLYSGSIWLLCPNRNENKSSSSSLPKKAGYYLSTWVAAVFVPLVYEWKGIQVSGWSYLLFLDLIEGVWRDIAAVLPAGCVKILFITKELWPMCKAVHKLIYIPKHQPAISRCFCILLKGRQQTRQYDHKSKSRRCVESVLCCISLKK